MQSIGLSGDVTYRPASWEIRNRAVFVRAEDEGEVSAQSLAYLFRASRKLAPRLSVYGQYDYARDGEDVSTGALDTGWAYKLRISATADFTDDFRWVESFYDSSDWRISHVAALTARVHSFLSLKVSHSTRYVNFPPAGFDNTDTIAAVALVAKF